MTTVSKFYPDRVVAVYKAWDEIQDQVHHVLVLGSFITGYPGNGDIVTHISIDTKRQMVRVAWGKTGSRMADGGGITSHRPIRFPLRWLSELPSEWKKELAALRLKTETRHVAKYDVEQEKRRKAILEEAAKHDSNALEQAQAELAALRAELTVLKGGKE